MNDRTSTDFVVIHPLDPGDATIAGAMRDMTRSSKGVSVGIEARGQFDAFMERVTPRDDVTFEADTIGGIPGMWVRPARWNPEQAIIHLHGGWFVLGSATAYRHLIGHIVARTGARAFVPDYRLAPEHPYPAAVDDVFACYQALGRSEIRRIALAGDSAGGNLALGLASRIVDRAVLSDGILVGVAVMSPVTDLTLSGQSYETRANADPLFTRAQIAKLVRSYLVTADAMQPLKRRLGRQAFDRTTHFGLRSALFLLASTPRLRCGWVCHMGFKEAWGD